MRQTVYKCDECKKEIGDKKHFSFQFAQYSGVAVPNKPLPYTAGEVVRWEVHNKLQGKFVHFCGMKCLADYFRTLLKNSNQE
jgi:hypothetical protein